MFLLIGDMHVKKDNIKESERIIDWIISLCVQNKYYPVFMGDQHDKHSIIQIEVLDFWVRSFGKFVDAGYDKPVVALSGNHDMSSDGVFSSMIAYNRAPVRVISDPSGVRVNQIGFLPFIRDNTEFESAAMNLYNQGARRILCHAEFDGAVYENGFYAPNGIKLDRFPADLKFISGHIHKAQSFGNVTYVGTPRQLASSEVDDVNKGLYTFNPTSFELGFIPTPDDVVEKFRVIEVTPENSKIDIPQSDKVLVRVTGPLDFCKKFAKKIPDGVKIKAIATDVAPVVSEVKESDGMSLAFSKYLKKYAKEKVLTADQMQSIAEKIFNKCPSLKG